MKRVNNLFDKIIDIENLKLAHKKASKGRSKNWGVMLFERNPNKKLQELHDALANGTFKTSPYFVFKIYEPKERDIYRLPYYPDRIVHHAIMNILEPIWVSIFTTDTYNCIKKRGITSIVKKLFKQLKQFPNDTIFCLKLDIRKFYPSINHDIMKEIIRKKIKDTRLLKLLDEIIDSAPGLPIGNYLSQYLANLYLAYFDHWIKEEKKVRFYYRYADDIVILADNKRFLHELLEDIRKYLTDLKLQIKPNYQIFPVESRGIDFVGYVFYHTHIKARKSIKKHFIKYTNQINKDKLFTEDKTTYKLAIARYWSWIKHCNSRHLFNKYSKYPNLFKR